MYNKLELKEAIEKTPLEFTFDSFLKYGWVAHINDLKALLGDNIEVFDYLTTVIKLGRSSRAKIFNAINGDEVDKGIISNNLNLSNIIYSTLFKHCGIEMEDNGSTVSNKLREATWEIDTPTSFSVRKMEKDLEGLEMVSGGDKEPLFDKFGFIRPTAKNFECEAKRPYLEEWLGICGLEEKEVIESYESLSSEVLSLFRDQNISDIIEESNGEILPFPLKDGLLNPSKENTKYIDTVKEYEGLAGEMENLVSIEKENLPIPLIMTREPKMKVRDTLFQHTTPKYFTGEVLDNLQIKSLSVKIEDDHIALEDNSLINGYIIDEDLNIAFIVVNGLLVGFEYLGYLSLDLEAGRKYPILDWYKYVESLDGSGHEPYAPIAKQSKQWFGEFGAEWLMLNSYIDVEKLSFNYCLTKEVNGHIHKKTIEEIINLTSFKNPSLNSDVVDVSPLVSSDNEERVDKLKDVLGGCIDNDVKSTYELDTLNVSHMEEEEIQSYTDTVMGLAEDTHLVNEEKSSKTQDESQTVVSKEDTKEVPLDKEETNSSSGTEEEKIMEDKNEDIVKEMMEDLDNIKDISYDKLALLTISNTRTMNTILSKINEVEQQVSKNNKIFKDISKGVVTCLNILDALDTDIIKPVKEQQKGDIGTKLSLQGLESKIDDISSLLTDIKSQGVIVKDEETISKEKEVMATEEAKRLAFVRNTNMETSIEFQNPLDEEGNEYGFSYGEIVEEVLSTYLSSGNLGTEVHNGKESLYTPGEPVAICDANGRIINPRIMDTYLKPVTARVKDSMTGRLFDISNGYIIKAECPIEGKRGMVPVINMREYYEYSGNDSIFNTRYLAKGEEEWGNFAEWLYELSKYDNFINIGFGKRLFDDVFIRHGIKGEVKEAIQVVNRPSPKQETNTQIKENNIPNIDKEQTYQKDGIIMCYGEGMLVTVAKESDGELVLATMKDGDNEIWGMRTVKINGVSFTATRMMDVLRMEPSDIKHITKSDLENIMASYQGLVLRTEEQMVLYGKNRSTVGLTSYKELMALNNQSSKQNNIEQNTSQFSNLSNLLGGNTTLEYSRDLSFDNLDCFSIPVNVMNGVVTYDGHDVNSLATHLLNNKASQPAIYTNIVGFLITLAVDCTTNSNQMLDKTNAEYLAMASVVNSVIKELLPRLGMVSQADVNPFLTIYTQNNPNRGGLSVTD